MKKHEWLQAIVSGTNSLAEISKSHPRVFNEVVSEQELQQLEGLTSSLAASVERRAIGHDDEDKRSFILSGDSILGY